MDRQVPTPEELSEWVEYLSGDDCMKETSEHHEWFSRCLDWASRMTRGESVVLDIIARLLTQDADEKTDGQCLDDVARFLSSLGVSVFDAPRAPFIEPDPATVSGIPRPSLDDLDEDDDCSDCDACGENGCDCGHFTTCTICDEMVIPIDCQGMAPEICGACERLLTKIGSNRPDLASGALLDILDDVPSPFGNAIE